MSSFTSLSPLLGGDNEHGDGTLGGALGRRGSSTTVSFRRSIDRTLRSQLFAHHSPYDPGEAAGEEAEWGVMSPVAREPACKEDGPAPGWAEAAAEMKRLLALAVPLVFQSLASMLLTIISTIFVGHLNDPTALSGVVLASSVFNVTGLSLVFGLSSALDTLCGQAYGARAYHLLGLYLQRARLICWVLCIPIALLWLNVRWMLLAIGQEPAIVDVASRYLALLTPSVFVSVISDTTRRYLLSQRVVLPGMTASIITTCLSPLYNWYFIYKLGWGTDGAAVAVLLCNITHAVQINGYRLYRDHVQLKGRPEATWGGCSPRDAFSGWGAYLTLGIPAAAMIWTEWSVWELIILLSGRLPRPDIAVATMGIYMQLSSLCWMMPASLGSATAIRVANMLGAGCARGAALVFRVSTFMALLIGAAAGTGLYAARGPVLALFTGDPGILAVAVGSFYMVSLSLLGDSCVAVLGAVLRAAGRQSIGAALNLFGYWCVGLPIAVYLAFSRSLGVLGFWTGLAIAAALQAVVFFGIISLRFDWGREVERARQLAAGDTSGGGAAALPPAGASPGAAGGHPDEEGGDGGDLRAPLLQP